MSDRSEMSEKSDRHASDDEPRELLRLVVGRIGKAHGLKGEVTVELRTDDPDLRFASGNTVVTEPAERGPLVVVSARSQSGRFVMSFEGVRDRDGAEALRDTLMVVYVDPDELPDDPDEYYDHQLVGLRAVTVTGRELGTVIEMVHLPAQDMFVVRRADGRELLIPFVADIVPELDLAAGLIRVDPPDGLLELADPTPRAATEPPPADEI